ncbi:MAG: M1 family aminopeptidase [Planctomycetota bacterium]
MIAQSLIALSLLPALQDPGIPIELAKARMAQIRSVAYRLTFRLDAGAKDVTGSAWIAFELENGPGSPVILDFEGEGLSEIRVNEADPLGAVVRRNGHVVISPSLLHEGGNEFYAEFRSDVARTGTPLTVYDDESDGKSYYYTLVVPADAHRLYPCFDQPDLKATFEITLEVPIGWSAVSNAPPAEDGAEIVGGRQRLVFRPTRPLSTYLMAFAAGPFSVIERTWPGIPGIDAGTPARMFFRESQRAHVDAQALFTLHENALRWMADSMATAYPFGKLDFVLVPGFPYGGMEHAGAIFYREKALAFDHPPTASELTRRSTLIYHEVCHQWFGNLVTMRWFDDLWLKEGFATFFSYECLQDLEPERGAWLRFLQGVEPRAYEVDATPGSVPIYQPLPNLEDAKSAYGPIVYNKAPAVLKELHRRLGASAFRKGLRAYLREHAFANAGWRDLAGALARASRTDLSEWSERWILAPSLPVVRARIEANDEGIVERFTVEQRAAFGSGTWPLALRLLALDPGGSWRTFRLSGDSAEIEVPGMTGRQAPLCVIANPDDDAYGIFLPDPHSRDWLLEHIGELRDPVLRAVAISSLFQSVREAEADPLRLAEVLTGLLRDEQDPDTHAWILGLIDSALYSYVSPSRGAPLRQRLAQMLHRQLSSGIPGRELQTFRFLARHDNGSETIALCRAVARSDDLPRGLVPGKQDRFLALACLLASGQENGEQTALEARFADQDLAKETFLARAAIPTPENKEAYWRTYTSLSEVPEQWIQDSLPWFHWQGQEHLTARYLKPALDLASWVKNHRRIFFMPAWLDQFVSNQSTPEALRAVQAFADADLPADIRQKLLQSTDKLRRKVLLLSKYR